MLGEEGMMMMGLQGMQSAGSFGAAASGKPVLLEAHEGFLLWP